MPQTAVNGNASVTTSRSGSSVGSSTSIPSLTSSSTASSMSSAQGVPLDALAQLIAKANGGSAKQAAVRTLPSITAPLVVDQQQLDESWKHQAQARAILGNLIGPNGEQLTSSDPYNTTVCLFRLHPRPLLINYTQVFVGGLSPLISEETLRTFFAPFGDIHYVSIYAGYVVWQDTHIYCRSRCPLERIAVSSNSSGKPTRKGQ